MNVRRLANKLFLGTNLLVATACNEVKHELPKTSSVPIVGLVDSFSKSKINQIDTAGLELYKVDTLEISKDLLANTEKLLKKIKKKAVLHIPEVPDGMTIGYGVGVKINGRFGTGFVYQEKMVPKYDPKSVKFSMQNKVYTNEDSSKFFVPVNYYGKSFQP